MTVFTARKVAQMSAVFAKKQGGTINILKLIKLLYLADKESMSRYGFPISFDRFKALDNGPILSKTLDLINGFLDGPEAAAWDEWITDRANHLVSLNQEDLKRDDLDELSDADLEVIESIWLQFGRMDKWTLRDYTHDNCSEWKDPHGHSLDISDRDALIDVGSDGDQASDLSDTIQAQRDLDNIFARL